MPVRLAVRASPAKSGWLPGLVVIAALFACSPVHRHAALDFVFDGVPPYLTPEERARQTLETEQRQAESEAPQQRGRPITKLARFTHGPFAADECTRCHDLTTASGFRSERGNAGGTQSALDLAEAGRLRMPIDELCVHCHSDFSGEAPDNDGLWLHGPVASGWCILCHEPHSARYPYLLNLEPVARLCSSCHLRDDLVETAEHRPLRVEDGFPDPPTVDPEDAAASIASVVQVVRDCTRCHDPHRGPDRLLLRPRHPWEGAEGSHVRSAGLNVSRGGDR